MVEEGEREREEELEVRSPKSMTVESPQAVKRGVSTSVQQYSSLHYTTLHYSLCI